MKSLLRRGLAALNLNVRRYDPTHDLGRLLNLYGVETIFDVGANGGMSGRWLRNLGFRGPIVSFEPVSENFLRLEAEAAGDPAWTCRRLALGDRPGQAVINVSGAQGGASSLLHATPDLARRDPSLATLRQEEVEVSTIDEMARAYYPEGDRLFLKLDVEGYERRVIEGARETLPRVVGMRVELALASCREGEEAMWEMVPYIYSLGFRLCGIEESWDDRLKGTAEVYYVDGVFFRTEKATAGAHRP